jgi:excinuclease ABC subunit C
VQVKSILDDIPGVGDKRRKALMRHFGSIEAVREATVEELAQADSMNQRAARQVYDFFHSIENSS